jgi:hypothetical protein
MRRAADASEASALVLVRSASRASRSVTRSCLNASRSKLESNPTSRPSAVTGSLCASLISRAESPV